MFRLALVPSSRWVGNHNSVVAEGCSCENYSIIKTGAYVEPHRVVEMRRTTESYEEAKKIRQEYN